MADADARAVGVAVALTTARDVAVGLALRRAVAVGARAEPPAGVAVGGKNENVGVFVVSAAEVARAVAFGESCAPDGDAAG